MERWRVGCTADVPLCRTLEPTPRQTYLKFCGCAHWNAGLLESDSLKVQLHGSPGSTFVTASSSRWHKSTSSCKFWRMRILLCCLVALLLSGCGNPAGTPCQTQGSGFTASHDCQHRCLSRWSVTCPDGKRVTPNTCSGSFSCSPGSCPDGQVCYHDDDPFDDRSYCVMANTCGDLTESALNDWELKTVARQNDVIQARLEKEARREKWRNENPDKVIASPAIEIPPESE